MRGNRRGAASRGISQLTRAMASWLVASVANTASGTRAQAGNASARARTRRPAARTRVSRVVLPR